MGHVHITWQNSSIGMENMMNPFYFKPYGGLVTVLFIKNNGGLMTVYKR
jgi:hypothetical protein